jgi:hypothetical protein
MARYSKHHIIYTITKRSHTATETSLSTHDVEIPLPAPRNRQRVESEIFRFILLSASEVDSSDQAMERVERLYHQHGGSHIGIVFLIAPTHQGTVAFMTLQIKYADKIQRTYSIALPALTVDSRLLSKMEIPLLPLSAIASLPGILCGFQRQIVSTRSAASRTRVDPLTTLLPYCTINPPMPEHARNVVSDLYSSIPALAKAATTREGKEGIRQYLSDIPSVAGRTVAEDVIDFWRQEFLVE